MQPLKLPMPAGMTEKHATYHMGCGTSQPPIASDNALTTSNGGCRRPGFRDQEGEPALLNVGGGRQRLATGIRSSDRWMRDDIPLSAALWRRVRAHVPAVLRGSAVTGLNERLRFLRYERGQHFAEHRDGVYVRPSSHPTCPLDRSQLTLLIYLNGGFKGGELAMMWGGWEDDDGAGEEVRCLIRPEAGLVVVHDHQIRHEAMAVRSCDRRYCIRTDIMFSADSAADVPDVPAHLSEDHDSASVLDTRCTSRQPAKADQHGGRESRRDPAGRRAEAASETKTTCRKRKACVMHEQTRGAAPGGDARASKSRGGANCARRLA